MVDPKPALEGAPSFAQLPAPVTFYDIDPFVICPLLFRQSLATGPTGAGRSPGSTRSAGRICATAP
jgi:hypothetical protein